MRCKKNFINPIFTTLLLSISSFHVYADSLSGNVATVVDALPVGLELALVSALTTDNNIFRLPDSNSTAKSESIKYAESLSGSVATVVDALPAGLQLALSSTLMTDNNNFRLSDSNSTAKSESINNADSLSGTIATVVDALPEGLQLALGFTLTTDNNIFRLPDSNSTPKSDSIKSAQAVLTYNKTYGMQTFTLEAALSHNQFNSFSYLDNSTSNYRGTWALKIDKNLSGMIGLMQTQTLVNFANTQVLSKILYTTQTHFISGDWWARGPWHVLLGGSENISSNSAIVTSQQNTRGLSTYTGISYVSEAQNSLSFKRQSTTGSYTNTSLNYLYQLDNGYTESDDLLDFNWVLSGKSQLSGELNHLSVNQNHFSLRNYTGMAGNINYLWSISGKTSLQFSAQRSFSQFLATYSSYDVTDDIAISPVWKLSEKTSLRATFDHGSVTYLGAIDGGAGAVRNDTTRSLMLGIDWAPTRTTILHSTIQHTNRDSNYSIYQFSDNAINMTGQILF